MIRILKRLAILMSLTGLLVFQGCGDSEQLKRQVLASQQQILAEQESVWHWKLLTLVAVVSGVVLGIILGSRADRK